MPRETKINRSPDGRWEEEVIPIDVPDGWTAHKEGIVICREDWHWCDQDMWWALGPDGWWLDVGTYSHEHKKYVCLALRQKPFREHQHFSEEWAKRHDTNPDEVFPDWQNPDERVELDSADEVADWIERWFDKLTAQA